MRWNPFLCVVESYMSTSPTGVHQVAGFTGLPQHTTVQPFYTHVDSKSANSALHINLAFSKKGPKGALHVCLQVTFATAVDGTVLKDTRQTASQATCQKL
eukprot:5411846-Amphidinium_carterae.1